MASLYVLTVYRTLCCTARYTPCRSEPTASAIRAALSRAVGEAVVRGAIIGLADTLPEVTAHTANIELNT